MSKKEQITPELQEIVNGLKEIQIKDGDFEGFLINVKKYLIPLVKPGVKLRYLKRALDSKIQNYIKNRVDDLGEGFNFFFDVNINGNGVLLVLRIRYFNTFDKISVFGGKEKEIQEKKNLLKEKQKKIFDLLNISDSVEIKGEDQYYYIFSPEQYLHNEYYLKINDLLKDGYKYSQIFNFREITGYSLIEKEQELEKAFKNEKKDNQEQILKDLYNSLLGKVDFSKETLDFIKKSEKILGFEIDINSDNKAITLQKAIIMDKTLKYLRGFLHFNISPSYYVSFDYTKTI